MCLSEGAEGKIAQNSTSYLCQAPLTGEKKSVRVMHNCLVLRKLLCAFNDPIVYEADRHSSECTTAQQTLIVSPEGVERGLNECLFFCTQITTMNICLICSLQTLTDPLGVSVTI